MSLPTPSTLAELLGLSSQDGVSRETTGEDVEKAYEIFDQVQASEIREKSLFWAHFDALVLPSLVSALLQSTIGFQRKLLSRTSKARLETTRHKPFCIEPSW